MKKLTLGLCLVTTTVALAHDIEYKVCKGDTLNAIASKYHVSGKSILHANDLPPNHHMRPGHLLLIPHVSTRVAKHLQNHSSTRLAAAHTQAHFRAYVVRNGDQDWSLAKRTGISLHALHTANPGIDWDHLRIGHAIRLPLSAVAAGRHHYLAAAKSDGKLHMKAHWHTVAQGENDWIIAHKAGIRLPLLKSLNTNLDVSNLRPGQKVRVPGSAVTRLAMQIHRIHSSHVAINGDNVTIRREAGVGAESICTVDQGTRAAVVDRDGAWYQLKFPKGTVGWVRGDLLKPVHFVDVVAEVHHTHHAAPVFHHVTYQAHRSVHPHPVFTHRHTEVATHWHRSEHRSRVASSGYATAAYVDPGDAQGILHAAHQMRGTRYSWGGASRSGTDCSGFTSQVFARNGHHLPRTSREQSGVGIRVTRDELKPGDLLFFHTRGHSRVVSHVAIYEGNGKFIHASSGGGRVQENSLNEGYYRNHFSTARRVFTHHGHKSERVASKHVEKSDPAPTAETSSTQSGPVTAR
jgi:cell wall-associated NlpC family hydrolase/LysM repeat protein